MVCGEIRVVNPGAIFAPSASNAVAVTAAVSSEALMKALRFVLPSTAALERIGLAGRARARRISAQALNDALDRPASYALIVFVMDTRTPKQRRRIMQAVKSKDTKQEMVVRRCLHAMGYRYRLHCKDPLRKPDIAFVGRKTSVGRFSDR